MAGFDIEFPDDFLSGVLETDPQELCSVTIPVCMFLFLLVLRKRVSVSVDSKNPLAEKDAIDKPARAAITLSVENRSHLLPVTKGIAKVRYENPFSGDKGKLSGHRVHCGHPPHRPCGQDC